MKPRPNGSSLGNFFVDVDQVESLGLAKNGHRGFPIISSSISTFLFIHLDVRAHVRLDGNLEKAYFVHDR